MPGRNAIKRNMSVRTVIEDLASIEDGSDVIDYLIDSEGLNYGSFVEVPNGIRRDQGRQEWYEAHLVDESGDGVIRYIELEASGDSPAFSDLKRHLKRHGSPINELFTVITYRESDEGPLISPLRDDLTFLQIEEQFSSEDVEVTFDLNYFTIKRFGVEPAYLDYLNDLTVDSGQGLASLERDVEEVFSIREVTRGFYQDFGEIFREDLQGAIHGLENPEENLNAYTRTVVNRVLFLLFIEEKGWLDGDIDYVENKYEEVAEEDDTHVYDDLFEPLFFEALSEQGTTESDRLGQIPFLNGGLFERKDIEEDVEIDEAFFDKLLSPEDGDDGEPKGFLRRYKISLHESNPSEQELVVDPEFIGRIFEMFMQEDERSEVGAFYTPKPITAYMAKNALKQHLVEQTDISHEKAVSLVSDHTAPESLTDDQIEAVDDALRSATVLDPAVGSGAFIIAMLEELVAISEALDGSRDDDRSRFQLKKEFIADTLYGVDIDPGGIELCKFRVWLHLMQDLNANHEEFVNSNEKFALPNLGFKFFVGNSLVGDFKPTEIKNILNNVGGDKSGDESMQATIEARHTGKRGMSDIVDEIGEKREEYLNAHGEEKNQIEDRLGDLLDEIDRLIDWDTSDFWMHEVVESADSYFKWGVNIPEVILEGGFDIVIGNPPYSGGENIGSGHYVKDLANFYENKYDIYDKIPRMQYELYQMFIIRGNELVRENGVFSFITSRTFLTIGSKEPTRRLLQNNWLHQLVLANSNTFDATVNPAIFIMSKKNNIINEYNFEYIDATETGISEYRNFVTNQSAPDGAVNKIDVPNAEGYYTPISIYKNNIRRGFFTPNPTNMDLYYRYLKEAAEIAQEWEDEIQDSRSLKQNEEKIRRNHLDSLKTNEVSLFGLLTQGGRGLTTGKNDEYLAYLDNTPPAEKVKKRNEGEFEYIEKNENTYKWMSRVIKQEHIANPSELSYKEKQNGINRDDNKVWVPIIKGKGESYYSPIKQFINWSEESVNKLENNSNSYLRNVRHYFTEGIFIPSGGTGIPTIRVAEPAVIDGSGAIYTPVDKQLISAKYLSGLLNSSLIKYIIDNFINNTVNTEVQDIRHVPVVIPKKQQANKIEEYVDEAIKIRKGESEAAIESIKKEIDSIVEEIYGVNIP